MPNTSPPDRARLPPELLPKILSFADPPTLATCLRVSRHFFHLAGPRLYRSITFQPSVDDSLLLGLGEPDSLKSLLLSHTHEFSLVYHRHPTRPDASSSTLRLPNLRTLRLSLRSAEYMNGLSTSYVPTSMGVCPLLTHLRPTTLILQEVDSYAAYRPFRIGMFPNLKNLPPIFQEVETLVLKPKSFQTREHLCRTRCLPLVTEIYPPSNKDITYVFETTPGGTWPPEPKHEFRWIQVEEMVKEFADVCRPVPGRTYTIVNAGRIRIRDYEINEEVEVEATQRLIEDGLRARFSEMGGGTEEVAKRQAGVLFKRIEEYTGEL